jgi:hypothetical protein
MAYNLGDPAFRKYKSFIALVKNWNWKEAADECHRNGVSTDPDRNEWTKELLNQAVHGK